MKERVYCLLSITCVYVRYVRYRWMDVQVYWTGHRDEMRMEMQVERIPYSAILISEVKCF